MLNLNRSCGLSAAFVVYVVVTLALPSLAQFETRTSISDPGEPQSLTVGDFNGDGFLDLAVVDDVAGRLSVLLGNGNGTFQNPTF